MHQVRFTTPIEITVDIPDSFIDSTEPVSYHQYDEDAVVSYAAGRANDYLQTLNGEEGLRVDHGGLDSLQAAEIVDTETPCACNPGGARVGLFHLPRCDRKGRVTS